MDARALLEDHVGRIEELFRGVLDDLDPAALHHRPGGTGNPIAWLLWHTARVQDDHVAGLSGGAQAWEEWRARFGLPLDPDDIGYGHTREQVDAVRVEDPDLLLGYHAAVHRLTLDHLAGVTDDDLDRVVDEHWDPPVTAGVRLVSIVGDCLQHLGQAAYLRGLHEDGARTG